MKRYALLISCALMALSMDVDARVSPTEALDKLKEGNKRFVADNPKHCDHAEDKRQSTIEKQRPYAVVLGCSDSRVSPEIVFDQGIGDIFVVRVAGNVAGPIELASIEYSVIHNDSSLIVVLGHENCGAVKAVLANDTKDIESVALLINPAVIETKFQKGNSLENAVKSNIKHAVTVLKNAAPIRERVEKGTVQVVGGYYNMNTGQVEWFM